jgi:DNA-binding SARP family transcriptional activator/ABC-type branched-subunit amino acid transport system substrate-binding protein/streptogramin lyase
VLRSTAQGGTALDFRILGPFEVFDQGQTVSVGAGKQRTLLAILLLHAGEAVSTDTLVDCLWGDRPPDSALNSVHIYVSQLRKALGDDRLATRGRGYALQVRPDDEHDVRRFELLLRQGRELLAGGDAESALIALSDALSLWRGPPLADFHAEEFAQGEIRRLEELRLAALEERIEAEFALGDAAAAVPELETLVHANPLRERLRAQLMLALYRSDRQADALAVYRDGRKLLVDDLGLDPGPALQELEQSILRQDPALRAPPRARAAARRRRGGLLIAGGAALLLTASVAIAVVEVTRGGGAGLTALAPNSVGVLDAASDRILASVPVPGAPTVLAVHGRTAWVESGRDTISKVAPFAGGLSQAITVGAQVSAIAAGPEAVWVASRATGTLTRIDAAYGTIARRLPIRPPSSYLAGLAIFDSWSVADGAGAVWVTDGSRRLLRIDRRTGKISRSGDVGVPLDTVTVDSGAIWTASSSTATVLRLDPSTEHVTARISIVSRPDLESPAPTGIAVGAGYVWVLNTNTATVTKIDPQQRGVVATIPIGIDREPLALAAGAGAAWVADHDGTLIRIDAATDSVHTIPFGLSLSDVAVSDGLVWVATRARSGPARTPGNVAKGRLQPLSSSCSPIYYQGGGTPQYLIASDLPLQGSTQFLSRQIVEATTLVLKQRGFRAGRYRVGFQVCDDSTPVNGLFAPTKCAANGRAFAADPSVIGVIAPFLSDCARLVIPVANRAPHGPLAMISPSNTYVGLTRRDPTTAPGEPGGYYPTGRRNYVRIIAADDFQGAADALLARRIRARRTYVLHDGLHYGLGIASEFTQAARKLGIGIAGFEAWDSRSNSYAALVARIRSSHADSVFLGGNLTDNGVALLTALRAGLGQRVTIIASDGFKPSGVITLVGAPADGIMISTAGLPSEELPPAGRRFVSAFDQTVGGTPSTFAVYAAQATDVLLDAIGRSNGTRASVTAALFTTRITNGIIGSFAITQSGDTTANVVTIYRISGDQPTTFAVIKVPENLVSPLR